MPLWIFLWSLAASDVNHAREIQTLFHCQFSKSIDVKFKANSYSLWKFCGTNQEGGGPVALWAGCTPAAYQLLSLIREDHTPASSKFNFPPRLPNRVYFTAFKIRNIPLNKLFHKQFAWCVQDTKSLTRVTWNFLHCWWIAFFDYSQTGYKQKKLHSGEVTASCCNRP